MQEVGKSGVQFIMEANVFERHYWIGRDEGKVEGLFSVKSYVLFILVAARYFISWCFQVWGWGLFTPALQLL